MRRGRKATETVLAAAVCLAVLVPLAPTGAANAASGVDRPRLTASQIRDAIRIPANPADGVFVDPAAVGTDYVDYLLSPAIRIERQGVKYWLNIEIFQPGEGATPFLEVFLYRIQGRYGFQLQNYEFQTDRAFPFDRQRLTTATFDGGSKQLGDSRIEVAFQSTSPLSGYRCDLYDGGRGRHKERHGVLSYAKFRIDTGTTFFGMITERPTRGRLMFDPGCVFPKKERRRPCPPTWALSAEAPPNNFPVIAEDSPGPADENTEGFAGAVTTIFHGVWPENIYRFGQDVVPGSDLPPPTWDETGATASIATDRFRYGSGAGTFRSKHAPQVGKTKTCRADGVKHTFRQYTYKGSWQISQRFVVHLDTGDVKLPQSPVGFLSVFDYSS